MNGACGPNFRLGGGEGKPRASGFRDPGATLPTLSLAVEWVRKHPESADGTPSHDSTVATKSRHDDMMCVRNPTSILPLLATLALPGGIGGQEHVTIRGKVADAGTGAPLEGVIVTAPLAGVRAFTDTTGAFHLELIRDRSYELVAEDLGYVPGRFTLGAEAEHTLATLLLTPVPGTLSGLAVLEDRLRQRRRRRGGHIRLLEHDSLLVSRERNAYTLVERVVPGARACDRQIENLCLPGGTRERAIRICIDDHRPPAGASALGSYDPSDLWLVEIYNRGRSVRVYSRWFVARIARDEEGLIPMNPSCR